MGAPQLPSNIPTDRLKFATMRTIPGPEGIEQDTAVFMEDTGEWIAGDADQAAAIRAVFPEASIAI